MRIHATKRGFTLIEVLAVIVIVGGLVALLFPVAQVALDRATGPKCLNNLRQIGIAVSLYASEHDNNIVPIPKNQSRWTGYGGALNSGPLNTYLGQNKSQSCYQCPGDARHHGINNTDIFQYYGNSYAMNEFLYYDETTIGFKNGFKLTAIEKPSQTIMLGDFFIYARYYYPTRGWNRSSWHGKEDSYLVNVLLCDGHAEAVTIVSGPGEGIWGNKKADADGRLKWTR